jgi:hypothetical protein
MTTTTLPGDIAQQLIDAAVWAPSVHNTQPWWFGTDGSALTLHADPERRLRAGDPGGRQMLISCGAALFTLRLTARHLGRIPEIRLPDDPDQPGLLAEVTMGARVPATPEEERMYARIRTRRTHRGGFTAEPLPTGLLSALGNQAHIEGAVLRVIADPRARLAMAALSQTAEQIQRMDPDHVAEMARWAPAPGSHRSDGVHDDAYPRRPEHTEPHFATRDFARGLGWGTPAPERPDTPGTASGTVPGVTVVVMTRGDGRQDRLRAGQALQRILLRAAEDGVSAAFHTQALELPELRELIRARLCGGDHPQLILRLGRTRHTVPGVRRPAADVTRERP